ncbi:hypothetical protein ACIBBE_23925 [Streptomyces sp. NPDC051644]|uniref:hypothetical protein n=1 Tax=Streptomyces sp. NPDC051644 TaxID=3365666 RepID=UPI003797CB3B
MLVRVARIRAALEDGGARMPTVTEPEWFAAVRAGTALPARDKQREQLGAYLGGIPAHHALTDEGCADILNQIEMLVVLKEMHAAGVQIRCARGGQFTNAVQLRAAFAEAQRAKATVDIPESVR